MIEIKFTGTPQEVVLDMAKLVEQLRAGERLMAIAHAQATAKAEAEGEGPKVEAAEGGVPKAEAVETKKRGRKPKEEPSAAPVVENVEQPAEDVFAKDDEPGLVAEEVVVPKDKDGLKAMFLSSDLPSTVATEILKKFATNEPVGKLSGIPLASYPAVVKAIEAAKKAAQ